MDKVAFLTANGYIYWGSILLAIGIVTFLPMVLAVRLGQKRRLLPLLIALPLALVFSAYLGRLIHWYCRFEGYESLGAALRQLTAGGFSLYALLSLLSDGSFSLIGVFLGVALAFGLVRLVHLDDDLPALLDCAAPAAALAIAVGRLGDLFTTADRGKILIEDPALQRLPVAASVINVTSGATEWRFATFCYQSIAAAGIFVILLLVFLLCRPPRRRSGDVCCAFLLLYCASQIALDSTRYDALFLRSNGFVSLEQILCAVALGAILAIYSVRSIRAKGFRFYHPVIWVLALGMLGGAGYMEYFVQRHGDRYVMAYNVMSACLADFLVLTAIMAITAWKARPRGLHEA